MIPKPKQTGKLRIMVLAGGISHEREISLKSGRRVADALTEYGASVEIREPDENLLANIKKDKPDVIWPVLHGASGEDGALRDILALTGVPFVGASPQAARLAWDKSIAKILVAGQGIQTPPSVTLPKETFKELDADSVLKAITNSLSLPLVVKPARSGSAQGVTLVNKVDQLSKAMIDAAVKCGANVSIQAPPPKVPKLVRERMIARAHMILRNKRESAENDAVMSERIVDTLLNILAL